MKNTLKAVMHADIGRIAARFVTTLYRKDPLLVMVLALTAISLAVFHYQVPHVNGPDQWRWNYTPWRSFIESFAICMLRLLPWAAGFGALAWWAIPRLRGRAKTTAGLALLIAWGMVFCLTSYRAIGPFGATHFGRTVQLEHASGFFQVAVKHMHPADLLSLYPEHMSEMPLHPSTHPPGGTVICRWVIDAYETSPALVKATRVAMSLFTLDLAEMTDDTLPHKMAAFGVGLLLLLAGLLTAWPLFLLVRDGFGGGLAARRAAWAAAIFWVHYPALMTFSPEFDEVYPFLSLAVAWLLLRGMNGGLVRAAWHGAVAGVIFTAGFLLSFTFGVWAPLLLAMLLLECVRRAGTWRVSVSSDDMRRVAWLIIGGVVTGLAILAVLRITLGMDLIAIFSRACELNQRFRLRAERTYWPWLFFSPWDVVLVTGPALMIPALVFAVRAVRCGIIRPNRVLSAWVMGPLGIIMMTLTGLMPGENARLYLMFIPSFAWAGAAWLTLHSRRRFWINFALMLIGQIVYFYILRTKIKFVDM